MTREAYIKAVKAKLEEISPYDEPGDFLAAGDSDEKEVKPIESYIDSTLDKAAWFCLTNLPLTLLALDVDHEEHYVDVDANGVGLINGIDDYWRMVRVRPADNLWERDCTSFISTSDPNYLIQQNKWTRGKACKPVVAYNPEQQALELFSFPGTTEAFGTTADLYYVDTTKKAQQVYSAVDDFVVLMCAAYVSEILGDANQAQIFQTEFNNKLNGVIK